MTNSLIVGATGYIGGALVAQLPRFAVTPRGSSRRASDIHLHLPDGAALDRTSGDFNQIVVTAQLTGENADWLVDRVDGSRWLVLSSAQVSSSFPAPGTELALAREDIVLSRGGTVIRPTMVFGRNGDANLTRVVRHRRRWGVPFPMGTGQQLVQPLHVDDLVALIAAHAHTPTPGLFSAGGDEAVPALELLLMIDEILGVRVPAISIPRQYLGVLRPILRLIGLRPDQIQRLDEDKTVDNADTSRSFNWWPAPLAHRLEQAINETCR